MKRARFHGQTYTFLEVLPGLVNNEATVMCAGPDGAHHACSLAEWQQHAVRPAERAAGASVTAGSPAKEKIALFCSLFRGRSDVYARRFYSDKTGRSGYVPVCRNDGRRGVCDKPGTKCSRCTYRSLKPLTGQAVVRHLQGRDQYGRDVIGVYPLLADNRTWFLAADFDEADWQLDAAAYRQAGEALGLTPAVERSRSGEGAHVWLFFSEPVAAHDARQLGSLLLHQAMSRRPEISFESYDRLFPSQDIVPAGGYGNLIALPFQGRAQADGNSLFVDEDYLQYEDQWAFLSGLARISAPQLSELLRQNAGHMSFAASATESASCPALEIEHGNMVRIRREGVPSGVLAQIRQLAAFHNPEFYKRQSMRLSVYKTPRIIDCSQTDATHLSLPRGCLNDLERCLNDLEVDYTLTDKRTKGRPVNVSFTGELRADQQEAAAALLAHDTGVLAAATAFGKTVVAAHVIGELKTNTLILVPSTALMEQWKVALSRFLVVREIPDLPQGRRGRRRKLEAIGQLGGGRHTNAGIIDIAVMQSLLEGPERKARNLVEDYGLVICDECHHVPAFSFERVLRSVRARRVYGLSATPSRADGLQDIIFMQCGPVRCEVNARQMAASHDYRRVMVPRFTKARTAGDLGVQGMQTALSLNADRNALILKDVTDLVQAGRTPLLLTARRDHAAALASALAQTGSANVFLLLGSDQAAVKRDKLAHLREAPPDKPLIVVATNRYVGEGFDLPRLDTLLLTAPFAWKGILAQNAGRLHRPYPGKEEVRIYDYVDLHVPAAERMFRKRQAEYVRQGYEVRTAADDQRTCRTVGGLEFRAALLADIRAATTEIQVWSYGADLDRLREIGQELKLRQATGVRVKVRLGRYRGVHKHQELLQGLGLDVAVDAAATYSAVVIDREVVWYGDAEYLGDSAGDALRFESVDVAGELLDFGANLRKARAEQLSLDLTFSRHSSLT